MVNTSEISFLQNKIFDIQNETDFAQTCLEVFYYQYKNNELYRTFADLLSKNPDKVQRFDQIPFLPISFFKEHKVYGSELPHQKIFSSSGTTGMIPSLHYVADLQLYETSFLKSFQQFYGNVEDYTILALLPGYLEREGSSLVYMVEKLIALTKDELSGFYLYDHQKLIENLKLAQLKKRKILLIGVTYALLDLAENNQLDLGETIVMETGGMKGNRKEMLREEIHILLKQKLGVKEIHSEYGMTELLSQAYSHGNGIFRTPNWMRILIRDMNDPLSNIGMGRSGGVNIIDLANLHSCSFISTMDLGKTYETGDFEILGRFDASDLRGCNLMV